MVLNTINDNDELIYSFLGWAPLLSKMMVPMQPMQINGRGFYW